ncbi:unnamed protein product, partial [Heterosigma akashiwo]
SRYSKFLLRPPHHAANDSESLDQSSGLTWGSLVTATQQPQTFILEIT